MPVVSAHLKLMEQHYLRMRRQVHKMLLSQDQLIIVHICSFKKNYQNQIKPIRVAKANKILNYIKHLLCIALLNLGDWTHYKWAQLINSIIIKTKLRYAPPPHSLNIGWSGPSRHCAFIKHFVLLKSIKK